MKRLDPWRTDSLVIRAFGREDFCDAYLDTLNDKEYMRSSRQADSVHTVASAMEYIEEVRSGGGELLASHDAVSGELVATVSLRSSKNGIHFDMGLMTIKNYAGTGYGRASWNAVLARLRNLGEVATVTAGTRSSNTAMVRIIEQAGFVRSDDLTARFDSAPDIVRFVLSLR